MTYLNVPAYQVPELVWEADDAQDYHNAMAAVGIIIIRKSRVFIFIMLFVGARSVV